MTRLMMQIPATQRSAYRAILTVVVVSTLLAMLAYSGPLGNAVTLSRALAASATSSTWMLASMSMGLAVTLLAIGVLADRIGRRQVFLAGAAVFTVANLGCVLATDMAVFVIARLVAGVGAAGMIATSLGLLVPVTEHAWQRSLTATWWSVAMGAGIALGPLSTGGLDLVGGWRGFYWLLALGGVAVWAGAYRIVPRHTDPAPLARARRLDWIGMVLLLCLLVTSITAIVTVRTDLGAAKAWAVAAAVILLALGPSQRFGTRRLITPGLFAHRPFLAATVAGFGTGAGVIAVMSFACTYWVTGLGMSTLRAGALLAAWSGTSAPARCWRPGRGPARRPRCCWPGIPPGPRPRCNWRAGWSAWPSASHC